MTEGLLIKCVKHYERTSDLSFWLFFCVAVTVTSFTRTRAVIYATAGQQCKQHVICKQEMGKNQLDILGHECLMSGKN